MDNNRGLPGTAVAFFVDQTLKGLGVIMLKEQLLGFALKTLSQAHETKERIKNSLPGQLVQLYVKNMKEKANRIVEQGLERLGNNTNPPHSMRTKVGNEYPSFTAIKAKKVRKSSIRHAKEIGSKRADVILEMIKNDHARLVQQQEDINGKKSLAYLVWALGHAERAGLAAGVSIHDVSSLLYRACNIELYPINISRVVYGNGALVKQAGQEDRTKTYLLTSDGFAIFKEKFL